MLASDALFNHLFVTPYKSKARSLQKSLDVTKVFDFTARKHVVVFAFAKVNSHVHTFSKPMNI